MLAEAAGFAFLSAISPAALLVMAVYLSSAEPRRVALTYTAGAIVMTAVVAVATLYAIRAAGLNLALRHDARYGLRLALGIAALAVAAVISLRSRLAPAGLGGSGRGIVSRLIARPTPGTAFTTGLIVFVPSVQFIAAVQVIATANLDVVATIVGMLIVVTLAVLLVWLPLVAYFAAPVATMNTLGAFDGWLRAHSRTLIVSALSICGIALVANGALGLAGPP